MVAELVLVEVGEVVEMVDVVEVDEPGWVVVGFKGTKATAAPTARIARTATPAKSAMLRSIGLPREPSVVKTTYENTLFRLLGVAVADHYGWTPAYIRRGWRLWEGRDDPRRTSRPAPVRRDVAQKCASTVLE